MDRYQEGALQYAECLLDGRREQAPTSCRRRSSRRTPAERSCATRAFPGWLRAIVRTMAARPWRGVQPSSAISEMLASPVASPEADLQARQEPQLLAVAISDLPEHERVVVHLFYLAGTSEEEIVGALGIPLNTVKRRLHSARPGSASNCCDFWAKHHGPARASLEFVQRVRLFRALDQADHATLRAADRSGTESRKRAAAA
jgi:RNA polymerase sigma factor (sigma-70 family)